jgi:hypothetical protein
MWRNPGDGYRRGLVQWNQEELDKITTDTDFRHALGLARGKTVVTNQSLVNLFLLMKEYIPKLCDSGDPVLIAEFGVARGGSLLFLASLAKRFLNNAGMLGLDTFRGHPEEEINNSIDWHKAGDFRVSQDEVSDLYSLCNSIIPTRIIKGRFQETAAILGVTPWIALCHIDADTRMGVSSAIEASIPHMLPGGYMVFDDPLFPTCIGAMEAVENLMVRKYGFNAEQVCPHLVYRYEP